MKIKKGLGTEGQIHKDFSKLMQQYELYDQLLASWWSYDASGEKRNAITGALLKAKGLKSGKPDYEFIMIKPDFLAKDCFIAHYLYLEFKKPKTSLSPAGKQSDNQKKFESIFKKVANVNYYVCYSVKEAIEILIEQGFLKNN